MLDKLRLRNFKSFQRCDIPLAPLTLLSGLNGAGKSTVIQSLALLRQSHEAGFLRDTGWLLNGELIELGTGEDVLHEDNDVPWIEIEVTEDRKPSLWKVKYVATGDVLPYGDLDNVPPVSGSLFGNTFQYIRADRVNPATSYGKSFHAVSRRRFMGPRGEYAAHFLALFRDDHVQERLRRGMESGATSRLLTQVNAWMQDFSPGVRIDVHEIEKTDFVRLSYCYGSGINSSNLYRPTNVGFGLTYSLPIVISCLSTPPGGVILLENPEAHLHPKGQAAMGRLMALTAAAGVQVVVETHSDHVLNGIRLSIKERVLDPDSIATHFFTRNESTRAAAIESPSINQQGRLNFWPEGFFDEWDKSIDALLD
jgi:predicted ATPase